MGVPRVVRDFTIAALILVVECAPCALILGGCVVGTPRLADGVAASVRTERLPLGADRLEVALGVPSKPDPSRPLIILVSGDGGWRPSERVVFEGLVRAGYEVAGLNAHAYLHHLGFRRAATDQVAWDLVRVGAFAESSLGLPDGAPFILAGVSRGAGLTVTAAAHRPLRGRLVGLLAVALTGEEEYVFQRHRNRHAWDGGDGDKAPRVDPYVSLARLGPLPVAVIQSTQDGYLPASEARRRFGPDTPWRRFVAVEADGHSFNGARDTMEQEAERAIAWILSAATPAPRASGSEEEGAAVTRRASNEVSGS